MVMLAKIRRRLALPGGSQSAPHRHPQTIRLDGRGSFALADAINPALLRLHGLKPRQDAAAFRHF
jgi:hypothetical protein